MRAPGVSGSPIKVIRFEAPLWFANAGRFLDRMLSEIKQDVRAIIVDMSTVPWVDFSAGIAIKEVIARAAEKRVLIRFAHANAKVQGMIQRLTTVDESSFFATNFDAQASISDPHQSPHQTSTAVDIRHPEITLELIDPVSDDSENESPMVVV